MIFVFYILAALLIFFSYRSFRGGISYLNYFKSELAKPRPDAARFASIIAPCKGLDEGLKQNLEALLRQDYPNYEVVFVVDDEADKAVPVIKEVSREYTNTKFIVAGKAVDSSQKIENLREAVLNISEKSEILVFVDSDARPNANWLRDLTAPLADENIGAATGYRWFISAKPTFASEIRSVWNASVASSLGPNTDANFCWGGSMAMRRGVFEKLNIREKWIGTLSDDFVVTRAMNEAGMAIHFVPQAMTPTIENCTFAGLLEFTTRQMKITRIYSPKLWVLSFVGSGLFIVTMVWAAAIAVFRFGNNADFFAAVTTLLAVCIFSTGKSWLRLSAIKLVLPDNSSELNQQFWTQNTLWLLTPAIFLCNCIAALLSRRMVWRGITYEMVSAKETKIISPDAGLSKPTYP